MNIKRVWRDVIVEFSYIAILVLFFIPMDKFIKIPLAILIGIISITTIIVHGYSKNN